MRGVGIGLVAAVVATGLVVAASALATGRPAKHEHAKKAGNGVTAYAYVVPGEVSLSVAPTLVAARSRNIVAVTEPSRGVYCLRAAPPVDVTAESWTVTPEAARSSAPSRAMFAYADVGACPSGSIGVRTYELAGAVAVPSEHVAFMVVVG